MHYVSVITFLTLSLYSLGQSNVVINEFMSNNQSTLIDEDGDYPDWIEIHNRSLNQIDLDGYGISDDLDTPYKWVFPSFTIPSGGFKIIMASNKDQIGSAFLHTNFKISSSGEVLFLTDPNGMQVDLVKPTPLNEDVSYGRSEDGGDMWERLYSSTPELTNSSSSGIIFSHESGFYPASISLSLIATNNHEIRYTMDGSDPKSTSNVLGAPLVLNDLNSVADNISNVDTSPYWVAPNVDNFKAHTIKSATFEQGIQTSNIYTKVIFIDANLNSRYSELDIISIVTDAENLFNQDTGIYVPGVNFSSSNTTWTGNYFQKGDLWERKANLQYFNSLGDIEFNQEVGIRTHGGKGRNLPQKSIRVYTHGDYGAPKLNYPFFEHLGEDQIVFDKVVIRNSMTGWNNSVIKDEVTAYICKDLNFEYQNSKPVAVFINGEYWGVQSVREYYDEKYISEKYDMEEDSVNIVLHGSGNRPSLPADWGEEEGANQGHIQLYDFLNNNSLTSPANYQYIENVLDIESIVDYYCTEIYFNNKDWPTNNNKLWSYGASGKWRQMLYDIDGGWQYLGVSYNQLARALSSTGSAQNSPYATFLFRKLFESKEFEDRFIARMACLMKTAFEADNVVDKVNFMKDLYVPVMQEHIDRWHRPSSVSSWNGGVNGLISFANQRKDYVIGHIENQFGISFDPEDYDCDLVGAPSSVNVVELENLLRIYPNPSADKIVWVDFDYPESSIDYKIYNLSGQIIKNGTLGNHEQLHMNFPSGIYVFSTEINGQQIIKRIITL